MRRRAEIDHMRALLPVPAAEVDLHEVYARHWVEVGGWRANMISSVDGAATAAGLSAGLQTPGDNAVFAVLRDLADVVLVGAGTAVAEGYGPARPGGARLEHRRRHGFADELPVVIVSRRLRLDPISPLLGAPGTIVVTCAAAPAVRLPAEVVVCGEEDLDYRRVRELLEGRGLRRVLCEGGPTVLGQVVAAGQLDELCLSVSPLLVGPGAPRIVTGMPWDPMVARDLTLTSLLEEDGALFLRLRARPST